MFTFAAHAAQRVTESLLRDVPLEDRADISALEWKVAPGLQFAQLPQHLLPVGLHALTSSAPFEIEYELMRIVDDVPLHYHDESGGVIKILADPRAPADIGLSFWGEICTWHKVGREEVVVIPSGTIHGFKLRTRAVLWVVSVNIPPLTTDDTIYI